jgi:hypothetical protein
VGESSDAQPVSAKRAIELFAGVHGALTLAELKAIGLRVMEKAIWGNGKPSGAANHLQAARTARIILAGTLRRN